MPKPKPMNNYTVAMERANEVGTEAKDLTRRLIDTMTCEAVKGHIAVLQNDIQILKRNIETLVRLGGEESKVGPLRQQLAKQQEELETMVAEYRQKCVKPRPWWQFWK